MTIEPITSFDELQNIILLGFDLWVITTFEKRPDLPWKLKNPRITYGARGAQLGSAIVEAQYVARWGIIDSDNHHTVRVFQKRHYLFNSQEEALEWKKREFKG